MEIPEGALLNNTIIKISQASSDIKYPLDSTAVVLKLEPAGTTFNEPVELAFPMPENLDTNFLSIYYFDPINHIVEKFPTEFDFANNEVITNIDHFSYYTMSDDGIFARVWMYYKNEKTTVRVRIYGRKDGGYYGFNGVPTFLSNYPWALQLIDEYEDITSNVVSQFDVQLRKNQYWPANIVEQQKLNIYRDMSYYTGDIDIKVYDESFAIPYYQINQSTSRERELFFGGEAICFNYNGELNNNDKYYPRIKWKLIKKSGNSKWDLTETYIFNGHRKRMKPSNMIQNDPDENNNHVDDIYEPSNPNTPPTATFNVSPSSGNVGTTLILTLQEVEIKK